MKKFDESEHPRDKEGKFTNKNTSSSSVATKEKRIKWIYRESEEV